LQYRLRTLLIVTALVGLILAGLRMPTRNMAELFFATAHVSLLTSILLVILCRGQSQTRAIGFMVFCGGYLALFNMAAVPQSIANDKLIDSPLGTSFATFFNYLHVRMEGGGLRSHYNRPDFLGICHYSLALALGLIGTIVANSLCRRTVSESETKPS